MVRASVETLGKPLRVRPFEAYKGTAVVTINTAITTIYTVPTGVVAVVQVEMTNTDTVANTYDLHIVAAGGSAAIGNRIVTARSLSANTLPDRLGAYYLAAGVTLQALVATAGGSNGDLNAVVAVQEYGTGDGAAY